MIKDDNQDDVQLFLAESRIDCKIVQDINREREREGGRERENKLYP